MAKKKTTKKATKKTAEPLAVGSKVKAYVKDKGLMCSGELVPAVSDQIYAILDGAIERAKANKRATVRPHDL